MLIATYLFPFLSAFSFILNLLFLIYFFRSSTISLEVQYFKRFNQPN